jgi:phosphate transport system protein
MSSEHIQKSFDHALLEVRNKVIIMADMVSMELSDSIKAFVDRDQEQAIDSVAADDLINASERLIDDLIIKSIVLHQPMASDCRQLIAALRISKDLERIGDYSTNIANHSTTLDQLELTGEEQRVTDMAHAVQTMLQEVIEAFTDRDTRKARLVRDQDMDVDELFTKIFSDLLNINSSNAKLASACSHLSFIARSLERIGDHITDIAEEILYIVDGKFPPDERIKADRSAFVKD